MFTSKIDSRSILGALGLNPSRWLRAARTGRRLLRLNVERFEDRVVPTVSILAPQAGAVQLVYNSTPALPLGPFALQGGFGGNAYTFTSNHQGEIGVTFYLPQSAKDTLAAADKATPGVTHGFQATLDSYMITKQGDPLSQVLIRTAADAKTTVLTLSNPIQTLFVEVDDVLCSQVDAINGVTDTMDIDDENVLAGAVFHPSFTGGVENFTIESTSLSQVYAPDAWKEVATDCVSKNTGNFGLTIGFWKNHYANWTTYATTTTVGSAFAGLNVPAYAGLANLTFAQALSLGGGPALSDTAGLLIKQAVGALLNAANPQVGYPMTTSQIKVAVNDALATMNANAIGTLQGQFDTMNSVDVSFITNPINNHQKH